jgi:hypothetical protein
MMQGKTDPVRRPGPAEARHDLRTVAGVWLLLAAMIAGARTAGAAAAQQIGESRVALAAVTDGRSRPLVDVGADDFVIQEGTAVREILSVRPADYPIVLLIDTGEAARTDFALMRRAVSNFVNRIGQRPVVIGTFGRVPRMLTTFEDDRPKVIARLEEVEAESGARSMIFQGVALGAHAIHSTGALFSAIVVVSATPDDASGDRPDEMTAAVIDSGAVLHVIVNRPAAAPAAVSGTGQTLRTLAQQNHGEYTAIYSPASYQAALDRLADRMSSEMMIEYLVPVGSKPNDVKVGVKVVGARVRGLGVAPR